MRRTFYFLADEALRDSHVIPQLLDDACCWRVCLSWFVYHFAGCHVPIMMDWSKVGKACLRLLGSPRSACGVAGPTKGASLWTVRGPIRDRPGYLFR